MPNFVMSPCACLPAPGFCLSWSKKVFCQNLKTRLFCTINLSLWRVDDWRLNRPSHLFEAEPKMGYIPPVSVEEITNKKGKKSDVWNWNAHLKHENKVSGRSKASQVTLTTTWGGVCTFGWAGSQNVGILLTRIKRHSRAATLEVEFNIMNAAKTQMWSTRKVFSVQSK